MKIEIRKRTDYDGVWYFNYQDDKCLKATRDIAEAERVHDELVRKHAEPEAWETVKLTEI